MATSTNKTLKIGDLVLSKESSYYSFGIIAKSGLVFCEVVWICYDDVWNDGQLYQDIIFNRYYIQRVKR